MLLVHVVTCVYDMYMHCSLETALFCLSALKERYQQALGGMYCVVFKVDMHL